MKKYLTITTIIFILTSCNSHNQISESMSTSFSSSPSIEESTSKESTYYTSNPFVKQEINLPSINVSKISFTSNEIIEATVKDAISTDKIGLYKYSDEPGKNKHIKQYSVQTNSSFEFNISDLALENGIYSLCLYQNKTFTIYDRIDIKINDDITDYKIINASIDYQKNGLLNKSSITFTPSTNKLLTYNLYWSYNGNRLIDYTPIKSIQTDKEITITFKEGLFMPLDANEIEIVPLEGESTPYYLTVDNSLKIKESKYLFNFQVMSDIHSNTSNFLYWKSHFISAMQDIYSYSGNTSGIIATGDLTDMGEGLQYNQFFNIIDSVFNKRPNIYCALGNHEYMYSMDSVGGYGAALKTFIRETNMENAYYSFKLNDYNFIFLASEEKSTAGSMNDEQFNWFKEEMEKQDKNKQTFIFLHQPLYETVIGSYNSSITGNGWYGINNKAADIKEILKNYPNAILFTGHTHYSLETEKSTIYGHGKNATFVNDGAIAYIYDDNYTEIAGSCGYFVEVYEDYILLKGREFVRKKWISYAQYVIPLYN